MHFEAYLPARPDYYREYYSAHEYNNILHELSSAQAGRNLCLGEEGLTTAGKVYTLFQQIKEFFGFENLTSQEKTSVECLKLLFYGATKGFQNPLYSKIFDKIQTNQLKVSNAVRDSFELLAKPGNITQETQLKLRDILDDYCTTHQNQLEPASWTVKDSTNVVILPVKTYFGDTYIAQAKEEMAYSYNVTPSIIKKYEAAAEWGPHNSEFSKRLVDSWYECLFRMNPSEKKLAEPLNSLLADRQYKNREYALATRLFDQVENLYPRQLTYKMFCHFELKEYSEVEKCILKLEKEKLLPEFKQEYTIIYIALGDFYKKKIGTLTTRTMNMVTLGSTPSDEGHKKKSVGFYAKAAVLANDPSLLVKIVDEMVIRSPQSSDTGLIASIKTKVKDKMGLAETKTLTPENELIQLAEEIIEDQGLNSVYLILIGMNDENDHIYLFTRCLKLFKKAIDTCLKNGVDKDICIDLISKVLKGLGTVEDYFKLKSDYVSYVSYEIKKTIVAEHEKLVKPKTSKTAINFLSVDMGASLHFLKAELMAANPAKYQEKEILKAYNLAMQLAPNNPFGVDSFFMVDEQASNNDDMQTLIVNARALAIRCGAK